MVELIKRAILSFTPSNSPDINGYALYWIPAAGGAVTRQNSQRIDLGNPSPNPDNGLVEIDLSSFPELSNLDDQFNLGVASYDDAGNESSLLTAGLEGVNLDFSAPNPPTNATISYV